MRFGIHLPQFGRAASPESIADAARQADDLGFAHVWVSDHLGIPADAPYPPAYMFDPLTTLTWAAAATTHIGLGTSVLVIPYRAPLALAKQLASIDVLSGGRLIVGAGPGWLAGEFAALGVPYDQRGVRTDEGIAAMRACWTERVVNYRATTVAIDGLRVVPQPGRPVPIWIGGASGRALRRAAALGDGWHAYQPNHEQLSGPIAELRRARPEPEFVISNRVDWNEASFAAQVKGFSEAGVQELVIVPTGKDQTSWRACVDEIADACRDFRQ